MKRLAAKVDRARRVEPLLSETPSREPDHLSTPVDTQSLEANSSPQPAPKQVARVHLSLLRWYAAEQRDLPWRSTTDPYAILVSEIMLQQTQVDRVLPKYRQFLTAFPTLQSLADAPTADVISVWVPLGYNMRAVRLQAIARQVVTEYQGRIPASVDELLKLKGIGRYTAGAIACFAYRQQVATVDTNIKRVLQRIFKGIEQPEPRSNEAQALNLAEQVLPPEEAYNWNQALMDLGATICTSNNPQCPRCPLQQDCHAYSEMSQHSLFPSGEVLRQLRKVAEKKANYETQPFTQSNRYFRGRIVDLLRTLPREQRLDLATLGHQIKADYNEAEQPWLHKLLTKLAKDGLIDYHEIEGARLP